MKLLLAPLQDGDQFWKIPEVYIRGNTIKYLRIPDEVILPLPLAFLHLSSGSILDQNRPRWRQHKLTPSAASAADLPARARTLSFSLQVIDIVKEDEVAKAKSGGGRGGGRGRGT